MCKRSYHFSYLPSDWLTLVWTHPFSQIGNTLVLLHHRLIKTCATPTDIYIYRILWLHHFCPIMLIGRFPSIFMVPSVVWLQNVLCSKSTFWVVPFTCYGSQCCLAPKCFLLKSSQVKLYCSISGNYAHNESSQKYKQDMNRKTNYISMEIVPLWSATEDTIVQWKLICPSSWQDLRWI